MIFERALINPMVIALSFFYTKYRKEIIVTKKEKWIVGVAGTLMGLFSGVAGTAYALGIDKQKINDRIQSNSCSIDELKEKHNKDVQEIVNNIEKKLDDIQDSLAKVEIRSNDLQVSVKVVEAIIQRIEDKIHD